MMCQPVGALIVGGLAGVLSVLGYKYLTVIGSFLALNACEKNRMGDESFAGGWNV